MANSADPDQLASMFSRTRVKGYSITRADCIHHNHPKLSDISNSYSTCTCMYPKFEQVDLTMSKSASRMANSAGLHQTYPLGAI